MSTAATMIPFRHRVAAARRRRMPRGGAGGLSARQRTWLWLFLVVLLPDQPLAPVAAATVEKYRSDEWITVCEPEPGTRTIGCSIMVPFGEIRNGKGGSFALVVLLDAGYIAIVGQPFPVRAVLRIDRDLPIECREWRYCLFRRDQSVAAIKELEVGSLILVDVFTVRATFRFSLTPRGYQAGIAQIRAWGHRFPAD
jgi:hypothetical protein